MSTANPNMNENINEYLKIHKELSELRKTQSKQKKRLIELESLIKSYMQDHNVDTLQGTNGGEIKLYDKKTYITDIILRSITNLFDKQFITILDSNPDFLPINNGKKNNLKTLEITDRTYYDYFTYRFNARYCRQTGRNYKI